MADLDALLSENARARLRDHYASRRVLHVPSGCTVPPAALFGLDQWERLLLQGAIRPGELRVMLDGARLDLQKLGIFGPAGRLDLSALARLTHQGASVVHNDLHRLVPGLWDLVRDAAHHFREQVGLGLITSFGTRSAFKRHFDQEDLLIVQLEGSKDWRFYGEPVPGPALQRAAGELPTEISATVTMQPGDVLYVPAGQTHECTASGARGDLVAFTRIIPTDNMLILFPSDRWHSVSRVVVESGDPRDARWTVNGWFNLPAGRPGESPRLP